MQTVDVFKNKLKNWLLPPKERKKNSLLSACRFSLVAICISFFYMPMSGLEVGDVPIIKCAINRIDKRKGDIALSAIFRDEANFLQEWIEYHQLVGVSHFYLYNNCSQDAFWEVLKPYVEKGIVELFEVPFDSYQYADGAATHNFVQVCCYNHAIQLASKANKWIAIIDTDEFICPVIDKDIKTALERFPRADGLVVYWQIYGTSNVWDLHPGELMIEKLLFKRPNGSDGLFKSIVKPQCVDRCMDPHWTALKNNSRLLMPDGRSFSHTPGFSQLPVDIIRINHYTFRTESFYYNHKKARRARWGDNPNLEEEKERLNEANSVYDPVMLRFIKKLKKRL